jgi:uncharacterized protein (DUF1800 family)
MAAKKKPNKPKITYVNLEEDGYFVKVRRTDVYCFQETRPGIIRNSGGQSGFITLKDEIKRLKAKRKTAQAAKLEKLSGQARRSCKVRPTSSLDEYKGPFGYEDAARLLRATGFGAPRNEVNTILGLSMKAAVDQIVDRNVIEPDIENQQTDLEEDAGYFGVSNPWYEADEENELPNALNENDVEQFGFRTSFYHFAMRTQNQLQAKLMLFIHDYNPASFDVLNGNERHAMRKHKNLIREFTKHGFIGVFLNGLINDHLMSRYLNRLTSTRFGVNEDFGRELLQLFGTGMRNEDGSAVYGDDTVDAVARACTGMRATNFQNNGFTSTYLAFSPDLHDSSAKIVFPGTPWQAVVYECRDVVEAIARHPATAYYWAGNIVRHFINGEPSEVLVKEAAAELRKSGLNIKVLLRKLLKSKAFWAPEARRTIMKLPIEYILDVLKTSGLPMPHPRQINWMLDGLGMEMWRPTTVFGAHPFARTLKGPRYVVATRNEIMNFLDRDYNSLIEDHNFDFFSQIIPERPSTDAIITRFAREIGVRINAAQRETLVRLMDYSIDWEGKEVRDVYDSFPGSDNGVWKALMLMNILWQLPDANLR